MSSVVLRTAWLTVFLVSGIANASTVQTCAHAHAHSDAYANADADSHADAQPDTDANAYSDTRANARPNTNADTRAITCAEFWLSRSSWLSNTRGRRGCAE